MIPGPLAVLLSLVAPFMSLAMAIRAFKRRAWRLYRNFSIASILSSIFCLFVMAYVVFLGRSPSVHEGVARMRVGLTCGAVPIFTFAVAVVSAAIGPLVIGPRTDDERPTPTIGRPMLAVFAVLLLAVLAIASFVIETKGRAIA